MRVDVSEKIARFFPLGGRPAQLDVVPGSASGEWVRSDAPAAIAVVRLIVWETRDGTESIRDIKEQELYMGWPVFYDDEERIEAFFAALGGVIAEIGLEAVECLMPHDLMRTDVLKLKRARTREDFDAALRAKSRLGKFLG